MPLSAASHPGESQVASYLAGALSGPDRVLFERHLAQCAECRAELAGVVRVLAAASRPRRIAAAGGMTAAAAMVILLLVPRLHAPPRDGAGVHREGPITSTAAPVTIAPRGAVGSVSPLTWTAVPGADRYRVQVMDSAGTALWQAETVDTSILIPDSIPLRRRALYFWRVQARIGFDRWAVSEFQDFTLSGTHP